MSPDERLAERFETERARLRGMAQRMLGSTAEADDAVQEAWLRLCRSDADSLDNLAGWLTTVTGRICLDMLRSRAVRREEPYSAFGPDAAARDARTADPEREAVLADTVGLALMVVLDRLTPAERIAYVLHDVFAVPFGEIAAVLDRSPTAARKLASRARGRLQGAQQAPGSNPPDRWKVVDAFLSAARDGDMDALLKVLDPDVVRRADRRALQADAPTEIRGADVVARSIMVFGRSARHARPALVDGSPGLVVRIRGQLRVVLRLTVEDRSITQIDVVADPDRLSQLVLADPDRPALSPADRRAGI